MRRQIGSIILARKRERETVAEEQERFRIGRGCLYQMFLWKQLVEKYRGKKELFVTFMELKRAYDKVCREEHRGY